MEKFGNVGREYTGHLFEEEILPAVTNAETWEEFKIAKKDRSRTEKDKIEDVIKHQPWNSSDPFNADHENHMAGDLHAQIAEALDIEDYNDLRLITARGSRLDYEDGIDAILFYGDNYVTIDLTLNPHKTSAKADWVVTPSIYDAIVNPDPSNPEQEILRTQHVSFLKSMLLGEGRKRLVA